MRKGRSPLLAPGPFLCLFLLSCGDSASPSSEDRRQLDNAEAMLDSAPAELANIDSGGLDRQEPDAPAD